MIAAVPGAAKGLLFARIVVDSSLTVSGVAFGGDETGPEDEGWLQRSFHYAIPEELHDKLRPGQLVWVPFGARQLQG
ncbi:MAG: hypothetical protein GXY68_12220, partial [Chloroflexi bacterium]|nr:hypothetical protein [Chloroflexota bacterium]